MADADQQVVLPTGGLAKRCQGSSVRTGQQCKRAAQPGQELCRVHSRHPATVANALPDVGGRPATHGLYANTAPATLRELRAQAALLDIELDDTTDELLTIKATLAALFRRADWLEQQSEMLENAIAAVAEVLAATPVVKGVPGAAELTVPQARAMAENLAEGRRLLTNITSFTGMLLDSNVKSIQASKLRADTRALKAESDAKKHFVALAIKTRNLLNELSPSPEWQDVFEYRLEQEIMAPERLALPE